MAKQRKALDETEEQGVERRYMEKVSNTANRSDKVSWNRKLDNMIKLLAQINVLQDKVQELEIQKEPILKSIAELRATMVNECIHPYDQLIHKEDHVHCKFCDRKIVVNNGD